MNMAIPGNKDELYDVSDSTDWLGTPLASLAPIDASLRCQVCKDFYKTPMITSCSHTFCSLCIRRCLANDGKCPACRTSEQENKLRSNWSIEGLVDEFIKARPALLSHSRAQPNVAQQLSPKRKFDEAEPDQPRKKTRSSSRLSARSQERENVVFLDAEDADDDEYQPEDGLVPCPVCHTRMKVEAIDSHLNRCLNESSHSPPPNSRSLLNPGGPPRSHTPLQNPSKKPDRLPQLNYSLFKDTALRKKLQELGISAQGSRQLLERRHTEWITIWNANCDASHPRKKAELLHELDAWERTHGIRAPSSNGVTNPASQIIHKDFDGAGWAAKHDLSFQNLIANARKNLSKAGPQKQMAETCDTAADAEEKSEGVLAHRVITPLNSTTTATITNNQAPSHFQQESTYERPAESEQRQNDGWI